MTDAKARTIAGAAVAAAAGALDAEKRAAEGSQLAMFDLPSRLEGADLAEQGVKVARARGPGRPPGAENRSTRELREYMLARGAHPLIELMRWSLHTPETLARELDCTRLEAFDRLTAIRRELAPYFVAKMAPTDEAGNVVPIFNLSIGGVAGGLGPGLPPWAELMSTGERQALLGTAENRHSGAAEDPQSHDQQSHEEAK